MSAQDKTEQVLREMHIMYANSEVYDKATNRVIIDKKEALNLLQRLNVCIYELMEEHELTQQSRDAAERQFRKKTDGIVEDANRMAEDVYAGSVMYTDEALHRVQDIMQDAMDSVREICDKMNDALAQEKSNVRRDQSELKSHLEDLRDTNKYMNLIEQRNKEIAKERAKREQEEEEATSVYASVKPEIKINEEYFEKNGIPLETEEPEEEPEKNTGETGAEIKVNLDAEYFKWKEDADGGKEQIRRKIFPPFNFIQEARKKYCRVIRLSSPILHLTRCLGDSGVLLRQPVGARRHAIVFPERVSEIIAVGKTADPGNFSDRSVRRAQKVRGVLKADVR